MIRLITGTAIFILTALQAFSQIPDIEIEDFNGMKGYLSNYIDPSKNHLIIFWASWNAPAKKQLDEMKDYYYSWTNNYNVSILVVSMDREVAYQQAKTQWAEKGWKGVPMFSLSDSTEQIFGFNFIPHIFLYDHTGNSIFDKAGFIKGDWAEVNELIMDNFSHVNSIDEEKSDKNILLYPNPTSGYMQISFDQNNILQGSIEIYDLSGRLLKEYEMISIPLMLNNSDLLSGTYIVRVRIKNKIYNKRIVII